MSVGRNDPCPCGSGKKYKHCCGKNNVVSLGEVILDELDRIQHQLIDFAEEQFQFTLTKEFNSIVSRLDKEYIPKGALEVLFLCWYVLNGKQRDGKTILQTYIGKNRNQIQRLRTRSIVENWPGNVRVVFGLSERKERRKYEITDWLTEKTYTVCTKEDILDDSIQLTLLVPFENGDWFQIGPPLNIDSNITPRVEKLVKEEFHVSGESNPEEFLRNRYIPLVNKVFREIMIRYDNKEPVEQGEGLKGSTPEPEKIVEYINWDQQVYKEVIEEFFYELELLWDSDNELKNRALSLWIFYCEERKPNIKKPEIYIAGLLYVLQSIGLIQTAFTYARLAEHFGVSAASISRAANEMLDFIYGKITKEMEKGAIQYRILQEPALVERTTWEVSLQIRDRNIEDFDEIQSSIQASLSDTKQPLIQTAKDRAQALLYDAFESMGEKKLNLAKKALDIYPNSPDAYTILAEFEPDEEVALQLLVKGVKAGLEECKEYLEDEDSPFWGVVDTRPFMRAKYNLGELLRDMGMLSEAIAEFEDLLRLNPRDHQGVRYVLIPLYIENGEFERAKTVIHDYLEETTFFTMYSLLIEIETKGLTKKARSLWKKIRNQNPYVYDYLSGRRKTADENSSTYSPGSKEEAVLLFDDIYVILIEREKCRTGLEQLIGAKIPLD